MWATWPHKRSRYPSTAVLGVQYRRLSEKNKRALSKVNFEFIDLSKELNLDRHPSPCIEITSWSLGIETQRENVVHTSSSPSRMELISSSSSRRATRCPPSTWISTPSRSSYREVCTEEEGMATIATKSVWGEEKGWLRRNAEGRYAPRAPA